HAERCGKREAQETDDLGSSGSSGSSGSGQCRGRLQPASFFAHSVEFCPRGAVFRILIQIKTGGGNAALVPCKVVRGTRVALVRRGVSPPPRRRYVNQPAGVSQSVRRGGCGDAHPLASRVRVRAQSSPSK